jgi:pilus assembly protein Flp/PilA
MSNALINLRTWLAAALPRPADERGASLVEYALLLVLIAVICIVAVTVLGQSVSTSYSSVATGFD